MNIATWNVNSVRARMPRLLEWLSETSPDIVCLQETKVVDDAFPRCELEEAGYNVVVHGQKTYNGVAILSKEHVDAVVRGFPGDEEGADARVIGGVVGDVIVVSVYVPNGKTVGHEKYVSKLAWLKRMRAFLDETYDAGEKVVVCGDYNITFDDRDVWDPEGLRETIHCSTAEREALAHVMEFGLHDAFRKHHEEAGKYSWWDHRGGAFWRDHGLRIDHHLMTEAALERCTAVEIERDMRKGKGPSDHVPVTATLAD
jgi:exodeoxyribonuclease-3